MNTSIRGHGKWGDFLVALIPLSWCCNILINSNFILRMIEWQNESSLFTIRVQGKQWYWVYKFDPNTAQSINSIPKNIGNNRWVIFLKNESYHADTYYQAIHLAAQLEFQDSYTNLADKNEINKKSLNTNILLSDKAIFTTNWEPKSDDILDESAINVIESISDDLSELIGDDYNYFEYESSSDKTLDYIVETCANYEYFYIPNNLSLSDFDDLSEEDTNLLLDLFGDEDDEYNISNNLHELGSYITTPSEYKSIDTVVKESLDIKLNKISSNSNLHLSDDFVLSLKFNEEENNQMYNSYYDFLRLDETSDSTGNLRAFNTTTPFRLIRGILNQQVLNILQNSDDVNFSNKLLFLNFKLTNSGELMKEKENIPETLWGFRQKKYKRMKKFNFKPQVIYDPNTFKAIGLNSFNLLSSVDIAGVDISHTTLKTEKNLSKSNLYNYYLSMKINRNKSELVPVTLARRLLRTKRTLVLPAHVNLTVITNSYDVVHSWFIPGLGLKMDCVPGRSTHHTFYIDNIGFYYGQCAEICGRYHHHMPIRMCALPFEQFVVWWHSKGLPRLNRLASINNNKFFKNTITGNITPYKLIFQSN